MTNESVNFNSLFQLQRVVEQMRPGVLGELLTAMGEEFEPVAWRDAHEAWSFAVAWQLLPGGKLNTLAEVLGRTQMAMHRDGQRVGCASVAKQIGVSPRLFYRFTRGTKTPLLMSFRACRQGVVREAVVRVAGRSGRTTGRAVAAELGWPEHRVRRRDAREAIPRVPISLRAATGRVDDAINRLREQGQPITLAAVARILGCAAPSLKSHRHVATRVRSAFKAQAREEEQRVRAAVAARRAAGQRVSASSISRELGISCNRLRANAHLRSLIPYRAPQSVPGDVIANAIDQLRASGKRVTKNTLRKVLGHSQDWFEYRPEIVSTIRRAAERDLELIGQQVRDAIAKRQIAGRRVSPGVIGRDLGRSHQYVRKNRYLRRVFEEALKSDPPPGGEP